MKRPFLILISLLLTSCSTFFVPSFNEQMYKSLEAGNIELSKLHQAIVVDGRPVPEFAKIEPLYVNSLAHFARARDLAEKRPDATPGLPSEESAKLIVQVIKNCEASINRLLTAHKARTQNIQMTDFNSQKGICSIPVAMENLLKK